MVPKDKRRMSGPRTNNPDKFWSQCDKSSGCWNWTGTLKSIGYGQFVMNGKAHLTHRLAYELHTGLSADGLVIRHSCDNRQCINPQHLIPGTTQDNAADRVSRKRSSWGVRNPAHKLSEANVIDIRARYSPRKVTMMMLAKEYGVTDGTISHIIVGRNWANL